VNPRGRWIAIAAAAIATATAVYLVPEGSQLVEAVPADKRETLRFPELPKRQPLGRLRADMFASHSVAPPAPPPQPQEQVAPTPPPNPYRFAGTLEQGGARKIFLTVNGDRLFEAKEGEVLEQNFRVQTVAANAVTLVYVPLDTPVTVALVFPQAPATAAAGGSSPAGAPPVGSPLAR
jgi:hypothetical protein